MNFRTIDVIRYYHINKSEENIFWLKLDTLIEITALKSGLKDYLYTLKSFWRNFFTHFECDDIVEVYIQQLKLPYKLAFEGGIRNINNDHFLIKMLAAEKVKICLIEDENGLVQNVKVKCFELASHIDADLRQVYLKQVGILMSLYCGKGNITINAQLKTAIVSYKNDLRTLHDIVIEEMVKRGKYQHHITDSNNNSLEPARDNDILKLQKTINQYKQSTHEQNEEITALKEDLEYSKKIGKDAFILVSEQRDTVIKDLFSKMNSPNNGNIFNNLLTVSQGNGDLDINDIKMILQNMFFVFKSFGITTYGNMGDKITVSPEQMDNGLFRLANNQETIETACLCQIIFPGWCMKSMKKDRDCFMPPVIKIIKK